MVGGNSDSKIPSPSLSVQVPPPSSSWVQVPSPPSLSLQFPTKGLSFDEDSTQGTQGDYYHLTQDKSHQFRQERGYAREAAKAAWKTRCLTMGATDQRRVRDTEGFMDASGDPPDVRGKRSRADDLHLAFCCEKRSSDRTRAMARSVGEETMECSGCFTLGMRGRRHLHPGSGSV